MRKTLEIRLQDAKETLSKIDAALARSDGKLSTDMSSQYRRIASFASNVEHWKQMIAARETARASIENLENHADANDDVPYVGSKAKFQTVRLLGVQGYLAAQWALADRLADMTGSVLCVQGSQDPKSKPQLVSHFVRGDGPEKKIAAIAFHSVRQSFGWPIGISYALRNHFLHDGGDGDFFEGPTRASAFKISGTGWERIQARLKDYKVSADHSRLASSWTPSAGDDLRKILDTCAREMDEALGVLVGTACHIAVAHIGFMLGED